MSFAHLRVRSQSCPMRGMVPLQVVADAGRGGGAAVVTDRNLWAQVKLAKLCAKSVMLRATGPSVPR